MTFAKIISKTTTGKESHVRNCGFHFSFLAWVCCHVKENNTPIYMPSRDDFSISLLPLSIDHNNLSDQSGFRANLPDADRWAVRACLVSYTCWKLSFPILGPCHTPVLSLSHGHRSLNFRRSKGMIWSEVGRTAPGYINQLNNNLSELSLSYGHTATARQLSAESCVNPVHWNNFRRSYNLMTTRFVRNRSFHSIQRLEVQFNNQKPTMHYY